MTKLFLFLALALMVSFMCSILEAVLLSINLPFIKSLESKNKKGSKILKKLKSEINKPIAAILTVNTIAHTVGAAGVGAESAKVFGENYMIVVSGILTLLILYLSEIIPKTIGTIYRKKLAVPAAYVIKWMIYLTYPLIIIADFTTRFFSGQNHNQITREELLANAHLSEDAGVIDENESDIIENTLNLSKSAVEEILTPRSVIFAFEKSIMIKEALESKDNLKAFSRIPIFENDIDHIIGFVLSKEILLAGLEESNQKIENLLKPIHDIQEDLPISQVLSLLISRKEHMFVVKDNYGQTSGLVTMEDCFETLLGEEIVDEFDKVEDLQLLAKKLLGKIN